MEIQSIRVCMLVKNSFTHDARVLREARTLVSHGYDVTVVALLAAGLPERETTSDGIHVIRVHRGPGASLHAVSDPSQSKEPSDLVPFKTTKHSVTRKIRTSAVQLIKLVASSPAGDLVQKSIDKRMRTAALSIQPHIMHAHDLDTLSVGVDVARTLDIPVIYDSHEIASQRNHHSARRKRHSFDLEKPLIDQVDRIIMVSQGCADYTSEIYNIAAPDVIMNCPDLPDKPLEARDLRVVLNIPKSDFLVVHQGSLQRNRGIEETIQAVRDIPDCTLVIIGFGQHRPALEQYVTDMKLDHKVKFFGPVPSTELVEWTASADIGIATIIGKSKSYLYSMPNKLFEYVMAGIPVIASDYPDMGTFVKNNGIGLICNPESANEIRSSILKLRDDDDLRNRCAQRSRDARNTFNWQTEQEKLLSLYNELLAHKP